jgi:hypothetical protein
MADTTLVALVAGSFGIGGTLIGTAGGYFLELRRGKDARAARNEARQQQRDEYQRQTLIEFQEVLGRYTKAVGTAALHYQKAGSYFGGKPLPKELNDEAFETGRRTCQLALRIRDVELRARFDRLWKFSVKRALVSTNPEFLSFSSGLVEHIRTVEKRLGEVLRPYL